MSDLHQSWRILDESVVIVHQTENILVIRHILGLLSLSHSFDPFWILCYTLLLSTLVRGMQFPWAKTYTYWTSHSTDVVSFVVQLSNAFHPWTPCSSCSLGMLLRCLSKEHNNELVLSMTSLDQSFGISSGPTFFWRYIDPRSILLKYLACFSWPCRSSILGDEYLSLLVITDSERYSV